jgi:hypothetical protein
MRLGSDQDDDLKSWQKNRKAALEKGLEPHFQPRNLRCKDRNRRATEMDIEEHQKKVIEFRDARDWERFQSKRSEVSASEIRELKDLC